MIVRVLFFVCCGFLHKTINLLKATLPRLELRRKPPSFKGHICGIWSKTFIFSHILTENQCGYRQSNVQLWNLPGSKALQFCYANLQEPFFFDERHFWTHVRNRSCDVTAMYSTADCVETWGERAAIWLNENLSSKNGGNVALKKCNKFSNQPVIYNIDRDLT